MGKYQKITKQDVLNLMMDIDLSVMSSINIMSISCISNCLETSKYQVRKYIKELKNDGLVDKDCCCIDPEYSNRCYFGFKITDKVKKMYQYKEKKQKYHNHINKIWGY